MRVAGRPAGATRNFSVLNAALRWGSLFCALAFVVVFVGCAPTRTGPTLDAIPPLKPGLARVFLVRDKAFGGMFDAGWQAYLDETPMGDLKTGTFVYVDRPAGPHRLYFAEPGALARASQQEISLLAGRSYYFRLHLNEKGEYINRNAATGGLAGGLIASAISAAADERGLFDFTPLDEGTARMVMADLHLAQ
jgi:hypothetical protein